MAQSLYQFVIDDDSPEISYFPFVNLEPSPNVTAGWQLLYTGSGAATGPGQVGVGTSYHYTSLNGASLLINWNGTGIQLVGSVSNASYNITLDGISSPYFPDLANNILASFDSLNNTNHSLLLTTIITNATSPNVFLSFDKAAVTYAPPAGIDNTTATFQAIADSDIAFMGLWNYVADSAGNSMHMSNTVGDSAEATFSGSAITIYGLTSSYSGNFTVTLDNITTDLSARSSYNNSDALLFYVTDLPESGLHHVTVTNQENRTLALRAGGMNFTSFTNSTTTSTVASNSVSIPAGTIAAIVLAVVLLLVIVGIFYFACFVRRKSRAINRRAILPGRRERSIGKQDDDVERVPSLRPASGVEVESTSLSTSKGYGFGLGLRRGLSFVYRKSKVGSNSSEMSPNGLVPQTESHPMTPQCDRDEKRSSMFTLTEELPVLEHVPESEKLAPGWSYSAARIPPSFKYHRGYKETYGILLPEIRVEPTGPVHDHNEDDADVKTLTSCQDEALAATLLLSPRTSEARAAFDGGAASKLDVDTHGGARQPYENQQCEFLQVRETSPFRVDVSAIFGMRRSNSSSGRTSGSGSSTWSKVRTRLYRKAHRDDGKQSDTERQETSSSPGPESVPMLLHAGVANPPSERTPGSGTYSFLDFTSSHVSLRRHSKTTTLSSTPAELGHGAKETSTWSENTSIRMARIERSRDNVLAPKPDAPSTASGGSQPSDGSGARTQPSAVGTQTQRSSPFPIPITIPPGVPSRQNVLPPSPTSPPPAEQYVVVPHLAPPELAISLATTSPTESVPFSVSEIHFRHSFSDYAGIDSRRASDASVLPPHPPLPPLGGSHYSPPPPYIVQRVLGLPMSPLSPLSPSPLAMLPRTSLDSPSSSASSIARRPGTGASPTQPPTAFRVSSLLGPRPQPLTAGSVRSSAAPQLPMQGGRGSLRGPAMTRREAMR